MPIRRRDEATTAAARGEKNCAIDRTPERWEPKVWIASALYKHGRFTAEMIATRRWLREQIREVRAID
jgi:hypothetical protein